MAPQSASDTRGSDNVGETTTMQPVATKARLVLPIKSLAHGKTRIADHIDLPNRRILITTLATNLIKANPHMRPLVISADAEVHEWALSLGAEPMNEPEGCSGLNGSVTAAVEYLRHGGTEHAVIAHADLAHASDLAWLALKGTVTLVPDRERNGTNVIALPTASAFTFEYGKGSFAKHLQQCEKLGLSHRVIADPLLAFDVDEPEDLAELSQVPGYQFLN